MPTPSSPLKKRATIKDIAREAGLSTASVSQALRPRENSNIKLPEETIERVRQIARDLGYRAHAGARSIRSSRFHNLGFFLAKVGEYNNSPEGYPAGIHDAAEANGYRLSLIRLPHRIEQIKAQIPAAFHEHSLDALIVTSFHEITGAIHELLSKDRLPIVYLNDKHDHNSIYIDETHGGRSMTEYLISRGYRSICFVLRRHAETSEDELEVHHSVVERVDGYKEAMVAAGLKPAVSVVYSDEAVGPSQDIPTDWWEKVKHHDCFFAYDDDLANKIGRFLYENKLRLPEDVGLAGYNGDYGAYSAWRPLTTMRIPSFEMGKAAFKMALELVEGNNAKPIRSQRFKPELVVGGTTK